MTTVYSVFNQMNKQIQLLIVNFGGPRDLGEVFPFLKMLLTDRDVIPAKLPYFLHKPLFTRVAKKRALKVREDYRKIGGKSPIFEDTEWIAQEIEKRTALPTLTFHRYLGETHPDFLEKIHATQAEEILVFPLFPQFSYATTGSIARFFAQNLSQEVLRKMRWIKSYPAHPAFVECMEKTIRDFLVHHHLKEEETLLLFSAHGLPKSFFTRGEIYETECHLSFEKISEKFPAAHALLSYQSRFGPEEWLRPYTEEVCKELVTNRKNVVVVPLTFTSDHIETLFEIEELYLPLIRTAGYSAFRCPALGRDAAWLDGITHILHDSNLSLNQMLIKN